MSIVIFDDELHCRTICADLITAFNEMDCFVGTKLEIVLSTSEYLDVINYLIMEVKRSLLELYYKELEQLDDKIFNTMNIDMSNVYKLISNIKIFMDSNMSSIIRLASK